MYHRKTQQLASSQVQMTPPPQSSIWTSYTMLMQIATKLYCSYTVAQSAGERFESPTFQLLYGALVLLTQNTSFSMYPWSINILMLKCHWIP